MGKEQEKEEDKKKEEEKEAESPRNRSTNEKTLGPELNETKSNVCEGNPPKKTQQQQQQRQQQKGPLRIDSRHVPLFG